ncbi:oligosaccharide flippase family protein [Candidatus Bathyarchaeota archaeon]|nr:oligosaccharide flippase family protein [Candidatus Bathyarchaeota archaeon]
MSKARAIGKVSARGGFNLFWGIAISSIVTAIGVLYVGRTLSPEEIGIITAVMTAPNLIKTFRDLGIDQATIKYTAQYRSEKRIAKVKQVLAAETMFEVILGFVLFAISFLLSGFLANLLDRPTIVPLIQIASLIVFAEALLKAAQSAFTGYERMGLQSTTLVIQSTFKTGLMVLLVSMGYGASGAIIGDTVSYLIAGSLSIILLYLVLYKKLEKQQDGLEIFATIKYMFKYGLPVSIAWIINAFLTQFYTILIVIYSTDVLLGNYYIALSFAVLVTFIVIPLTTILFPAFSKIDAQKELETMKNVFKSSVKYASLVVVPSTFAVMVLAQSAISTLFGEKYEFTPLYVALYVVIYLYTAIGSLSVDNLIKSQGRTDVNLKLTLITAAMGLSLSVILIPIFGIMGLLATYLVAGIPSTLLALWWVKKHFNVTIDWMSSAKILSASGIAAAITYVTVSQLNIANWVALIIGTVIFFAAYLVAVPILGAVNRKDIQYLKETLNALGPLAPLLNIPLKIVERIADTFHKTPNI